MSLHFNWSRLDETCAEALRQLVNKRLAEVVERINAKSAGGGAAANGQGTSSAAPNLASGSAAGTKSVTGVNTAVSSPLLGSNGSNPVRAEASSNVSAYGSPRETYSSLLAAPDAASRSPYLTAVASGGTAGFSSVTAMPSSSPSPAAAATAAGAAAPSQYNMSDIGGGVPIARADGSGQSRGGTLNAAIANPTNAGGDFAGGIKISGGGVGGVGGQSRSGAPVAGGVPSGVTREADGATTRTDPPKVPPLVYLEVGSLEWGTTPPFVEIVAFKNATDGPPGYNSAPQQQQHHRGSVALTRPPLGSPLGDGRDVSSYALSHATSADSTMASSTALVGFFPSPAGCPNIGGGGMNGVAGVDAVASGVGDNGSDSSHDFTVSHSATGVSTPHIATAGVQMGMAGSTAAAGAAPPAQTQGPTVSLSHFPSQPETSTDMLASVLGTGGLHVRFHITYGGALHLSLNTAVQHELRLGAVSLRVSLPMLFYLANLDLDCYLCINIKNNVCQVWLEHGPLSSSVVNRLSITATFGGDEDLDGGGVDYGASSADFYSRFGSSSISDDDVGEGGNGAFVNEHEVSQFVLHELRAILKETIVAPHCITIPISFSG